MSQSQFPKPWKPLPPVEGSYDRAEYSPRWQFNRRDAGSTAAFAMVIQPVIASAIAWLEVQAEQSGGGLSASGAGAAYVSIFSVAMLCKITVGFLKSYGTSVVHDVGTWIWQVVFEPFFKWLIDQISMLFPGHHRRVRRRDRWDERIDPEPRPRRESIWERWRDRRDDRRNRDDR